MTRFEPGSLADDDKRGCVLLGNWLLFTLGAMVALPHAAWLVSIARGLPDTSHGWSRLGYWVLGVPSVLVGATLAIAAGSSVVPRGLRLAQFALAAFLVVALVVEFVTV